MLENLTTETIEAIFNALPVDLTFVDATDIVRYYNKGDDRIFRRTPSAIGRKMQECHPQRRLDKIEQLISELKSGSINAVEYSIYLNGRKIYIRNIAVRDKDVRYSGILEVDQDITDIQNI